MADWCDDRAALREQYADADNLEARIALHEAFAERFEDGRLEVEKTVGMLVARRA